jgi:hypothetical protein
MLDRDWSMIPQDLISHTAEHTQQLDPMVSDENIKMWKAKQRQKLQHSGKNSHGISPGQLKQFSDNLAWNLQKNPKCLCKIKLVYVKFSKFCIYNVMYREVLVYVR